MTPAIAWAATTSKPTTNNETMRSYPWWIGIQTHSARKYRRISMSRDATARNLTVWRNIVSVSRRDSNVMRTVSVKAARIVFMRRVRSRVTRESVSWLLKSRERWSRYEVDGWLSIVLYLLYLSSYDSSYE